MRVIISAMPRVGGTVIESILRQIYKAENVGTNFYKFIEPLLQDISKRCPIDFLCTSGFLVKEKNCIEIEIILKDKLNNAIKGRFWFKVDNKIIEFLNMDEKNILHRIHERPENISNHTYFKKFKKIFIIRNIFDTIHSHCRYIDGEEKTYNIIDKYKDQNILSLIRYKNFNFLLETITKWKYYVNDYLKYKDEWIIIRYEDFIKNPFVTIRNVIEKIDKHKNLCEHEIHYIIKKNLNIELPLKIHKYFQHYNPGRKIGDFNRFFTDEMIDFVYSLTKNELEALGYDINELVDKSIEKYERIDEIEEAYKDLAQDYKLIENSSSIAILGAARAATIAYEGLKEKFNVICFIDDFKTGELFSIPIVSREEFGKNFVNKVDFIVKGPHQKGFYINELYDKKIISYEKCVFL